MFTIVLLNGAACNFPPKLSSSRRRKGAPKRKSNDALEKYFSAASSNDAEIVPAPEKISLARKSHFHRSWSTAGGGGIISSEKLFYLF